ncbi:MAG: hypothetical protein ACK5HR_01590 [Mycoplasmatales bacterium]
MKIKKIIAVFSMALIFGTLAIPTVSATSVTKDHYTWSYGTGSGSVYSSYDNNQPHSASVKANGTPTYKISTNSKNKRVKITLTNVYHGRKSYYNYW